MTSLISVEKITSRNHSLMQIYRIVATHKKVEKSLDLDFGTIRMCFVALHNSLFSLNFRLFRSNVRQS